MVARASKMVLTTSAILAVGAAWCDAAIILSVDRTGGASGDRAPIGVYDGNTDPLANQAGGLTNGNDYFSDRDFTINSVPAAYEGAQYVRTFNSDKANSGVNYAVTTGEAADIWILIDDRFSGSFQSVADGIVSDFAAAGTFTDSGINVTLTEGGSNRTLSLFGASNSYVAGTYDFGGQSNSNNFYSIVFTPIPEPSVALLGTLGALLLLRRRR